MAEQKVVLVTGAGRGIGKAILLRLAQQPGVVAIGVDYNEAAAQAITQYLAEAGYHGEGFVMDVTDQAAVNRVVEQVTEKYGPVEILVNNAGITRDNLMMRMSHEEWDQVIATNLTSVFNVSQACIKGMLKARRGRIVNISSVVGCAGNAGQVNYSATKAGVIGFSKSLAQEIASRNITVNCVAPGFIETDMTRKLTDEQRAKLTERIPMRRIGAIDDVVNAVNFLVSDQASYITGVTIHVNGGMYMV